MKVISRRHFLQISGVTAVGLTLSQLGFDLSPLEAYAIELTEFRLKGARETITICPYCSVGCGQIVATSGGKVINVEGDPEHITSEGALCAKGASVQELVNNPARLTKVMYRAPYGTEWKAKSWDWALAEIAKKVKKTRDSRFIEVNEKGQVANRW